MYPLQHHSRPYVYLNSSHPVKQHVHSNPCTQPLVEENQIRRTVEPPCKPATEHDEDPLVDGRVLDMLKAYRPSEDIVQACEWIEARVTIEYLLEMPRASSTVLKIYFLMAQDSLINKGYIRIRRTDELYSRYQARGLLNNQEKAFSYHYNNLEWLRCAVLKDALKNNAFQCVVLEILNHFEELKITPRQMDRTCTHVLKWTREPLLAATVLRVLHDPAINWQVDPKKLSRQLWNRDFKLLNSNIGLVPFLHSHELPLSTSDSEYRKSLLNTVSSDGYMALIETLPALTIPAESIVTLFKNVRFRAQFLSPEQKQLWKLRLIHESRLTEQEKQKLSLFC